MKNPPRKDSEPQKGRGLTMEITGSALPVIAD